MEKYYVYLIRAGAFIKIGHSSAIEKRMETMQTGNPMELKLIAKMPFATRNAAEDMERYLHKRCRHFHWRGEWFKDGCLRLAQASTRPLPSKKKPFQNEKTAKDKRWM